MVDVNLRHAFPTLTEPARRQLAAEAYDNLGRTSVAALTLGAASPEAVLERFDRAEGWPLLEAALAGGARNRPATPLSRTVGARRTPISRGSR